MTRDRFLAGAMVPAATYLAAQRFRSWFREQVDALLRTVDVVLVPATPFAAPNVGQREMVIDGAGVSTQTYLGAYTQPISFAGLPALTVPVATADGLPLGVQLVGARGSEATLLRLAAYVEAAGLTRVPDEKSWPRRALRSRS